MGKEDNKKTIIIPADIHLTDVPERAGRGLVTHINPDPLPPVLNPVQSSTPDKHGK